MTAPGSAWVPFVEIAAPPLVVGFEGRAPARARSTERQMRFVLFTYPDPDYAERWTGLPEADRAAEIAEHEAWFARYGDRVRGGADLAWPKIVRTVRRRQDQPVVTDGPYVEGKELLGGVIIVEASDLEEACAMAAEWPSLQQGPGAAVQVEAVTAH